MAYVDQMEVLPIGHQVVDIDSGASTYSWIPTKTHVCYGVVGQMVETAGSSLAKTNQVAIKQSTTVLFNLNVTSDLAQGNEITGTAGSGGSFPYKFKEGTTYTICTNDAESTKNGTVLVKLFCTLVDP